MFDRFDIVEAHYMYYTEWHNGQWSREYKRRCHMQKYFKPSTLLNNSESLTENGYEIYINLLNKEG